MATGTSLRDSTNTSESNTVETTDAPLFTAQWNTQDATSLLPQDAPIPKVQRAWDRTPRSPFAPKLLRRRVRHVWRRPAPPVAKHAAADAPTTVEHARVKRSKPLISGPSPLRVTKKVRLPAFESRARDWEIRAQVSPVRKNITRTVVADPSLNEDEEDKQDGLDLVAVEVVDEDEMEPVENDELQTDDVWEDAETEEMTADCSNELDTTAAEAKEEEKEDDVGLEEDQDYGSAKFMDGPSGPKIDLHTSARIITRSTAIEPLLELEEEKQDQVPPITIEILAEDGTVLRASTKTIEEDIWEDEDEQLTRSPITEEAHELLEEEIETIEQRENVAGILEEQEASIAAPGLPQDGSQQVMNLNRPPSSDTVDVQDDSSPAIFADFSSPGSPPRPSLWTQPPAIDKEVIADTVQPMSATADELTDSSEHEDGKPLDDGTLNETDISEAVTAEQDQIEDADQLPELGVDPGLTVAALPVRQSPRRKSTSPAKSSRMTNTATPPPSSPAQLQLETELHIEAARDSPRRKSKSPVQAHRRSSMRKSTTPRSKPLLPPLQDMLSIHSSDELQPPVSPSPAKKPRVSDDTALLQAFLTRAAERKINKRDSDAVRHALASPAKVDILTDLDPNTSSPSPLKQSELAFAQHAEQDGSALGTAEEIEANEEGPGNTLGQPKARRSARDKSRQLKFRAPTAANPGPNRIAIKGQSEQVSLKRSEAQEMALLTRTNTRKNKGGSVLPVLRLTKMAGEPPSLEDPSEVRIERVKWAETLASFAECPPSPELLALDDNGQPALALDSVAPAAPLPIDTPSKPKPKPKRLKTPKTATANQALLQPDLEPVSTEPKVPTSPSTRSQITALPPIESEPGPNSHAAIAAVKPKKSRIATPAKGPAAVSLLPTDMIPETKVPTTKRAIPTPASKLPASQGKENLRLRSPKKSGIPSITRFAPKLDLPTETPGLMSPAKKPRRAVLFSDDGDGGEATKPIQMPGLSSPAKKRGRKLI